ncbi:MAG TPA: phosphate ABC transporter permease subunit PstC [Gaiellaceae bacterium]|nr:phosphate ABC transporter permease subunit PstC [Gaiellaceae bacterium]
MSSIPATHALAGTRRLRDRLGDRLLFLLTLLAALAAVAIMVAIAYKVLRGAHLSFSAFGFGFLSSTTWDATNGVFGAATLLFGTAVTSAIALLVGGPFAIAIALFLSELAPRGVRAAVGTLVEMLAAIPSVVLGLWGILVMGPFLADHLEPALHRWFGFVPLFGEASTGSDVFLAGLILAIMIVPIVASICRELFLAIPQELEDGALALGATRWEMVRGVVLSGSKSGIAAALILGLGRALGEAIAVAQMIGAGSAIHGSLFTPGDTLASRIAEQFQGAVSRLQISSLFYLAAILLVIGLGTNLVALLIVRRYGAQRQGAA